jgi:hypothetical protein
MEAGERAVGCWTRRCHDRPRTGSYWAILRQVGARGMTSALPRLRRSSAATSTSRDAHMSWLVRSNRTYAPSNSSSRNSGVRLVPEKSDTAVTPSSCTSRNTHAARNGQDVAPTQQGSGWAGSYSCGRRNNRCPVSPLVSVPTSSQRRLPKTSSHLSRPSPSFAYSGWTQFEVRTVVDDRWHLGLPDVLHNKTGICPLHRRSLLAGSVCQRREVVHIGELPRVICAQLVHQACYPCGGPLPISGRPPGMT